MKYILVLSKQDLRLSLFEASEYFGLKKIESKKELVLINLPDNKAKAIKNLAYTNFAYEILFSCKISELVGKTNKFDWQKHYKK